MKKLLFILPPTLQEEDFFNPPPNVANTVKNGRKFGQVITDLPLGIISLSAYLKKYMDINIETLDFNVELNKADDINSSSYKEFFKKIMESKFLEFNPDIVGISALFTSSHQSIIDIASVSKYISNKAFVMVGGNYPTSAHASLLNATLFIDAICYGEGEKPLLNFLLSDDIESFIKSSEQWVNREKLFNPLAKLSHDFIYDLDEIPPYDYDIVDIEGYKINPNSSRYAVKEKYSTTSVDGIGEFATGLIERKSINHSMPIMTSRGCPFKCTFCASHVAHGREMRYHSLERVQSDTLRMVEKYGIDGVVIQDDHFMAGKYRPYEIVKMIGDMSLGMYFQNALAMYALDLEFLKLIKKSGVDSLVLPLESGSNRVLKELMKKPLRLDIVPRILKDCREAEIFTDVNIIIGMPGETHADIFESRQFLKTIYADWFRIFAAMPIAGSEMYERCKKEGLFSGEELDANYKRPVITTGELTSDDILNYTYMLNIELNFIFNSNIRLGKYNLAIKSFENVLAVKSDHAIALHYIAYCYEMMGDVDRSYFYYDKSRVAYMADSFWKKFFDEFDIKMKNNILMQ